MNGSSGTRALDAVRDRLQGSPLLVALDIDGTLAPIVARPDLARVPDETRAILERLTSAGVHVAFVTGRSAADGARLGDIAHAWVIGNHGVERMSPDGSLIVDERVRRYESATAESRDAIQRELGDVPGVIVEDKRWTLSVHYRLSDESAHDRIRSAVDRCAEPRGLRITRGKMIVEVRPPVDINKGTAVVALAHDLDALDEPGNVLFAGDDHTDEDAIRRLRDADSRAVTIHVGDARLSDGTRSEAELIVPDTEAMRALLEQLAELRA